MKISRNVNINLNYLYLHFCTIFRVGKYENKRLAIINIYRL